MLPIFAPRVVLSLPLDYVLICCVFFLFFLLWYKIWISYCDWLEIVFLMSLFFIASTHLYLRFISILIEWLKCLKYLVCTNCSSCFLVHLKFYWFDIFQFCILYIFFCYFHRIKYVVLFEHTCIVFHHSFKILNNLICIPNGKNGKSPNKLAFGPFFLEFKIALDSSHIAEKNSKFQIDILTRPKKTRFFTLSSIFWNKKSIF